MKNLNILFLQQRILIVLFGCFLLFTISASAQTPTPPSCDADAPEAKDPNTQVSWRIIKNTSEDFVLRIHAKYKPADKEYTDAQNLYSTARNNYNAYLEAALLQLVEKQKGDLSPSAKNACTAAAGFQKFVVDKTTSKSFLAFLPVAKTLIEFGIGLYDKFKEREKNKRKSIADAVRKDVTWKTWSEIVKANTQ